MDIDRLEVLAYHETAQHLGRREAEIEAELERRRMIRDMEAEIGARRDTYQALLDIVAESPVEVEPNQTFSPPIIVGEYPIDMIGGGTTTRNLIARVEPSVTEVNGTPFVVRVGFYVEVRDHDSELGIAGAHSSELREADGSSVRGAKLSEESFLPNIVPDPNVPEKSRRGSDDFKIDTDTDEMPLEYVAQMKEAIEVDHVIMKQTLRLLTGENEEA